jgi:hypothetical protein
VPDDLARRQCADTDYTGHAAYDEERRTHSMDNPTVFRRRVWDEMLFASMRANYFGELVDRYQRREKIIRVAVLVSSSGAAATVLSSAPEWLKLGFPIAAACGSFWLVFSQYGMMARDAADLHSGWSLAESRYESLWNRLDAPDAEQEFDRIYEQANVLSKNGTRFPYYAKRLEYWLDHAASIATARYA